MSKECFCSVSTEPKIDCLARLPLAVLARCGYAFALYQFAGYGNLNRVALSVKAYLVQYMYHFTANLTHVAVNGGQRWPGIQYQL